MSGGPVVSCTAQKGKTPVVGPPCQVQPTELIKSTPSVKSEIRNPKSETNSDFNVRMKKTMSREHQPSRLWRHAVLIIDFSNI
jgi:hypothetical protein